MSNLKECIMSYGKQLGKNLIMSSTSIGQLDLKACVMDRDNIDTMNLKECVAFYANKK
jgi:hypothetical protein